MKVWMCKRDGSYSGGLAVVAANSKEEAFDIYHKDPEHDWEYEECFDDGYCYQRENWFECKQLTANVDKPCVIMEDGFTE
jgi:hypothetical protein